MMENDVKLWREIDYGHQPAFMETVVAEQCHSLKERLRSGRVCFMI